MKIDRKARKSNSELGDKAKKFIAELSLLKGSDFTRKLATVTNWEFGKSELCLWADVLNQIDDILENAASRKAENSMAIKCDLPDQSELIGQVTDALKFTAQLFEYSFTRGVYNMSMEHLITLLESSDFTVVSAVLNMLYVSSKRTRYMSSLPQIQKEALLLRLTCIAEGWGGREAGYSFAQCCEENFAPHGRPSTSLHFEFYDESHDDSTHVESSSAASRIHYVHIDHVDRIQKSAGEIMDDIIRLYKIPDDKRIHLLTQVRWAQSFGDFRKRANCIIVRLLSISVLIYTNMFQESSHSLLYTNFIEECIEALQLEDSPIVLEVKTEILKTLTAIIYLDRNPKLNAVIEATGASAYHGYLPSLVRTCIENFIAEKPMMSPNYVIALFSLLYHMAGYDAGAEALISSALTESLLRLVNWTKCPIDLIIYVTRAVRIIDLITNVNSQAFQSLDGMNIFINRLAYDVEVCRKEEPHQIELSLHRQSTSSEAPASPPEHPNDGVTSEELITTAQSAMGEPTSTASSSSITTAISSSPQTNVQCCPQRLVLIKSSLNFIKKAITDQQFSEHIRHLMDGSLPNSLRHIISNPDYYGSMLFLRAIVVVTTFINQEPSQLTSLQDKGITDVIMHALLVKEIPPSREVLAHLPQAFSALCLNERGLNAFMTCNPFEKLFNVLLSPKYLNAMRKRRNGDSLGDTAISLGSAIDEIMRHQATLKPRAMEAVIKLLEELCNLGSNAKYSCSPKTGGRTPSSTTLADGPASLINSGHQPSGGTCSSTNVDAVGTNGGDTSEEDDDDEEEDSRQAAGGRDDVGGQGSPTTTTGNSESKVSIPLVEYVQNVMKLIEAILSNNSTDDHARLFLQLKGLPLLLKVLTLPNLPADFGVHSACHNVATVIRYLLSLTRDQRVLASLLNQLNDFCLKNLAYLRTATFSERGFSHFYDDAIKFPVFNADEVPNSPLFRAMGCVLSHLVVLNHINRLGTNIDVKVQILSAWSEKNGDALVHLHDLYRIVLWENVMMHSMDKTLTIINATAETAPPAVSFVDIAGKDLVKATTSAENQVDAMDVDLASTSVKPTEPLSRQPGPEQLKPYTEMSLKVSRHLAELFNLLTRVSVGGMTRSRRGQAPYAMAPTANGLSIVDRLMTYLCSAFDWQPPLAGGTKAKQWLAYLVSLIDYLTQLLFDDRKQAYHTALAKFYSTGLQQVFFRLLGKVVIRLQIYNLELNDAYSQFPLAWLNLVEKLVNSQYISESSYQFYETSGSLGFNSDQFIAVTHKMAYDEIVLYWDTVTKVNARVTDLVLTLMCHILKTDIAEETKTSKEVAAKKKEETTRNLIDQLNPAHLQRLMDMGFAREAAVEALLATGNVDQAAEYLITMTYGNARAVSFGTIQFSVFDEEEQIRRAIEMSLGGAMNESEPTNSGQQPIASSNTEMVTKQPAPSTATPTASPPGDVKPLAEAPVLCTSDLRSFFDERLSDGSPSLSLVDSSPELVYRLADLLSVAVTKAGRSWTDRMLEAFGREIMSLCNSLSDISNDTAKAGHDKLTEFNESKLSGSFAIRVHLFCLLLEEFKDECCLLIKKLQLHKPMIDLLSSCCGIMKTAKSSPEEGTTDIHKTPRWLAPVLLCLDAYDRECGALEYRLAAKNINNLVWKYWDNRNWTSFGPSVNKQITDAFKAGLHSFKFTNNRRRYMVDFVMMIQVNLDSGYQRPVIFLPIDKAPENSAAENPPSDQMAQSASRNDISTTPMISLTPITDSERGLLLKSIVTLIEAPIDADTLHAALRLCLRITRNYSFALEFLTLGGVYQLLRLKLHQTFAGLPTILSLLVRHIVEEEHVLKQTMERVVRHVAHGGVATVDASNSPTELHYVLRLLGGVACRDQTGFIETAKSLLRIKVPPPHKSDDDEAALLNPNLSVELRVETTPAMHSTLGAASKEVLTRLLNYLASKHDAVDGSASNKKELPLIQKSAVLKLIAELIRSYNCVAQFITDYRYTPACGDLITEECSALAFFFDTLLVENKSINGADVECLLGVRAVVATLAAANHCEDAQCALVAEVKHALQRALTHPESQSKHVRICSLVSLISLMKDACPVVHVTPSMVTSTGGAAVATSATTAAAKPVDEATGGGVKPCGVQPSSTRSSNIVKWLVKKRLMADLARVSHSLDMRSPYFVTTTNCALKPLEELARLVNAPSLTTGHSTRGRRTSSQTVSAQAADSAHLVPAPQEEQRQANGIVDQTAPYGLAASDALDMHNISRSETIDTTAADTTATTTDTNVSQAPTDATSTTATPTVTIDVALSGADTDDLDRHHRQHARRRHPARNATAAIVINSLESSADVNTSDDDDVSDSTVTSDTSDDSSPSSAGEHHDRDNRALSASSSRSSLSQHGTRSHHHRRRHTLSEEEDDDDDEEDEDEDEDDDDAHEPRAQLLSIAPAAQGEADVDLAPPPVVIADTGNEHGSEQDDEAASDYEDVEGVDDDDDDEAIEHDEEDDEDMDDASEFDETADAVQIDLNDAIDDDLNNILRETLGRSEGRDYGRLLFGPLNGNGTNAPDLDGYLPTSTYTTGFNAPALGMLASTHPLLVRHGDSPMLTGHGAATSAVVLHDDLSSVQTAASTLPSGEWRTVLPFGATRPDGNVVGVQLPTTAAGHGHGLLRQNAVRRHHRTYRYVVNAGNGGDATLARLLSSGAVGIAWQLSRQLRLPTTDSATTRLIISEDSPLRDYEQSESGTGRRINVLSSVPNAYVRWCDEARILYGDAVFYIMAARFPEIMAHLDQCRQVEFEARRARRAEMADEEKRQADAAAARSTAEPAASSAPQDFAVSAETPAQPSSESTAAQQPMVEGEELRHRSSSPMDATPAAAAGTDATAVTAATTEEQPAAITAVTPGGDSQSEFQSALDNIEQSASATDSLMTALSDSSIQLSASEEPSEPPPTSSDEQQAPTATVTSEHQLIAPSTTEAASNQPSNDALDGVDPAFLAALPENIRQEVIADQMRLQRLRTQNQQRATASATADANNVTAAAVAAAEVSPEFLAALPPELQEEVLAQQRLAQQMLNPPAADTPLDPVAFMEALPPTLRQQVLADADESQIALLPADLVAEARRLRSQFDQVDRMAAMARHTHHLPLVNLLSRRREPGGGGFGSRYPRHGTFNNRSQLIRSSINPLTRGELGMNLSSIAGGRSSTSAACRVGQQILDKEAVCCLLVLFFIDDQRLMVGRIHRILRCLCCHVPTRDWIVRSLLAILEKTQGSLADTKSGRMADGGIVADATGEPSSFAPEVNGLDDQLTCGTKRSAHAWLNLTLSDATASAGRKIEVFDVATATRRQPLAATGVKRHSVTSHQQQTAFASSAVSVRVHPQAAVNVCRHVIDTLIILAKSFPAAFFPSDLQERIDSAAKLSAASSKTTLKILSGHDVPGQPTEPATDASASAAALTAGVHKATPSTYGGHAHGPATSSCESDFWDVLLRLDANYGTPLGQHAPTTPRKISASGSQKTQPLAAKSSASSNQIAPGTGLVFEAPATYSSLNDSPFGQLTTVLKYDVVCSNDTLTDSLLRLLLLAVNFLPSVSDHVTALQPSWESAARNAGQSASLLPHLSELVEIVTRGKLNEDCLEQGRGVLLRAAQVFGESTKEAIFWSLVQSASKLGSELCEQLKQLLHEVNILHAARDDQTPGTSASPSKLPQPTVHLPLSGRQGRHHGVKTVVQNASNKELQLPSMSLLTSKNSVQQCFLRTLNTLITLREGTQTEPKLGVRSTNGAAASVRQPVATTSTPVEQAASIQLQSDAEPMDVDSTDKKPSPLSDPECALSKFLPVDQLWEFLGECLKRLSDASDPHIVLVLQPAVEAFFLVHACRKKDKTKPGQRQITGLPTEPVAGVDLGQPNETGAQDGGQQGAPPSPATADTMTASLGQSQKESQTLAVLPEDVQKFVKFAEEHRTVLNQILRQSNEHLADGPFAVLVDYTRILDFDVKRRYFRKELERSDDGYRRDDVAVRVRRDLVFQDSFRELFRLRPNEWKSRFYIIFEGEEGQDAGGLLREWFSIITREIFNPDYALFQTAPGDRVTYMINPSSYVNVEHLDYFKFVGRLIAKAVYDNKLLDCYFTRAFYKHILSKQVKYTDLESEDPSFYQSLCFLLDNHVDVIGNEFTFSLEVTEFGTYEIRDLKPNGRNIAVTEENKQEYVRLVCQMKMTGAIRQQLNAFLTGFYDIIPRHLISIFNEQELELLISGLPNIDVDDLQANTEYNKYTKTSLQIQWFWRALRSFDQADRAKFLQFVTGTSKVPLQGFAALEGMHGVQRFQIHRDDRSTNRLPTAHTCFNQLDLPPYETYDKLRDSVLLAIRECTEGFGFA